MEVGFLLDRVHQNPVGRAVVDCVRRRTTIYSSVGAAQTDVDPYEDMAGVMVSNDRIEEAQIDASTVGANAMIMIDIHGRTQTTGGAVLRSPDASLHHELVHAVNVTAGNFALHRAFTGEGIRRFGAPSQEERFVLLIDNMYRSASGMWLRTRHEEGAMLPPGTPLRSETSGTGLTEVEGRVVSECNRRVSHLARRLEALDERVSPYNPFRRFARLSPLSRPH
jgi:hypothetical protein